MTKGTIFVFFIGLIIGALRMAFFLIIVHNARSIDSFHTEAVEHHVAYYHPQTGEFT